MEEGGLPGGELGHSQQGVPHVVDHLGHPVLALRVEGALGPPKDVQDNVPESIVAKHYHEVDTEPANFFYTL